MQNLQTNPKPHGHQNSLQELYDRLGTSHRLAAADKPIFAKNLGSLAARISPENPLEGARRIVLHSGNENLWPTKRKKFFRLPDEDAPPAGKDGDYASNPFQFRKLAEAAGELLCKSNKPEVVQSWKMMAIKALATGSSFMPSFVPAGVSDRSAKDLLDEYANVLVEAVKSRTRITELWEILQNTPIGLAIDQENSSPYGDAASFPQSLLTPLYRDSVKTGHLTTMSTWMGDGWSKPCIVLGRASFPVRIRMFCIPEEKGHLFACKPNGDRQLPNEALEWLQSAGFSLEQREFPDIDVQAQTYGWKDTNANIFLKVGLGITHDGDAEPKVEICLWGDLDYAAHPNQNVLSSNVAEIAASPGLFQHWGLETTEMEYLEVVYDRPFRPSDGQDAVAIGLLPSCWQLGSQSVEWAAPTIWLDEASSDTGADVYANNYTCGWTDEEFIAKLLMSEETEFYPIVPESEPVGGVLPSGSIGASLLQNARFAGQTNRITQLLIEKVALTAETGLRFYEAMVEDFRSAIHRI
jgi:hypothetical protein